MRYNKNYGHLRLYEENLSVNNKQRKEHYVRTVLNSNGNIVERGKIDTSNTQIHDCSLS